MCTEYPLSLTFQRFSEITLSFIVHAGVDSRVVWVKGYTVVEGPL